jgi:hypothetical protein
MIILESLLNYFEVNVVLGGSLGSVENWLDPKTKAPYQSLAYLKRFVDARVFNKKVNLPICLPSIVNIVNVLRLEGTVD